MTIEMLAQNGKTVYIDSEVYEVQKNESVHLKDDPDLQPGCLVRLIGDSPETIGEHEDPEYCYTVGAFDFVPGSAGFLRRNLRPCSNPLKLASVEQWDKDFPQPSTSRYKHIYNRMAKARAEAEFRAKRERNKLKPEQIVELTDMGIPVNINDGCGLKILGQEHYCTPVICLDIESSMPDANELKRLRESIPDLLQSFSGDFKAWIMEQPLPLADGINPLIFCKASADHWLLGRRPGWYFKRYLSQDEYYPFPDSTPSAPWNLDQVLDYLQSEG